MSKPLGLKVSSQFCPCGAHVALVPTDQPNVLRAVEYAADRFTPSERMHSCPAVDRRPAWH